MSTTMPNRVFPEPPGWMQRLYPGVRPDAQIIIRNPKTGEPYWTSNEGPQTWAALCPYEEMLVGGRRGGGKSAFLIADFAMGDPLLAPDDPAQQSYLNCKEFRGLLLREEYQSMAEFVEQAVEFFRPFGGKATGKPTQIDFKSGARIYFNHLGDEEAFNKYKGWNLTKIGIEELTQVRTLRRYLKLMGSLRSVDRIYQGKRLPALRTQMISTTNPDGPGAPWVKARFVEVPRKGGGLIAWNTPMLDPITGSRRIFIPFTIADNPYLSEDTAAGKRYQSMLLSQDEVTRKQWMLGDWNAGSSMYFSEYRPDGPVGQEEQDKFPWARHRVESVPLEPWYFRWGSGDWGYDHPAAFHKFCRNERDKRVHVYDELQVRRVGSFELGATVAKWWHEDLIALQKAGRDPVLTIYMGADTFAKTDAQKTTAEQMVAGIKEVLGPYGAMLLKYNEDEHEVMMRDPKRAQMMFDLRKREIAGHIAIALKPVYFDRVQAWSYIRDWIRFRPAVMPLQTPKDREDYLRQVMAEQGAMAYEQQAAVIRDLKPEILPKVQIWKICVQLDRCLKVAQRDERNEDDPSKQSKREDVLKFNADSEGRNGDDALESFRNGAVAYKEIESIMPEQFWVAERLHQAQEANREAFGQELTDPTRLAMIALRQQALYQKQFANAGAGTFTPARRVQ